MTAPEKSFIIVEPITNNAPIIATNGVAGNNGVLNKVAGSTSLSSFCDVK